MQAASSDDDVNRTTSPGLSLNITTAPAVPKRRSSCPSEHVHDARRRRNPGCRRRRDMAAHHRTRHVATHDRPCDAAARPEPGLRPVVLLGSRNRHRVPRPVRRRLDGRHHRPGVRRPVGSLHRHPSRADDAMAHLGGPRDKDQRPSAGHRDPLARPGRQHRQVRRQLEPPLQLPRPRRPRFEDLDPTPTAASRRTRAPRPPPAPQPPASAEDARRPSAQDRPRGAS